jgi:hypothetical protein
MPFDAESIAGILAGIKHETSRVIVPQPEWKHEFNAWSDRRGGLFYNGPALLRFCPYSVGDVVAATERFTSWADEATKEAARASMFDDSLPVGPVIYAADFVKGCPPLDVGGCERWLPPFLMRADQSRLTIGIMSTGAGRVQNLSYNDIVAEGYVPPPDDRLTLTADELWAKLQAADDWWQRRWDGINAPEYPYESNPWAYRYGFKVLQAPVADRAVEE